MFCKSRFVQPACDGALAAQQSAYHAAFMAVVNRQGYDFAVYRCGFRFSAYLAFSVLFYQEALVSVLIDAVALLASQLCEPRFAYISRTHFVYPLLRPAMSCRVRVGRIVLLS